MHCTIYRSEKKTYTYLYLAAGQELADLPQALLQQLGELSLVMELDLAQRQNLAQAKLELVKQQLTEHGFYLQLPPEKSVEQQLQQRFS